jgi:hypothetical protein
MSRLSNEDRERLEKLDAMFNSPPENANEADNARIKIEEFLAARGLTWDDRDRLLGRGNVLRVVEDILEEYIWTTPEERLAIALWVLHTHVYEKYKITPRLALLSPVFGCGKTTLMILMEHLVANPSRYDNVSAALVYRQIHSAIPPTLLLDEANNLNIFHDNHLRAVLNTNRHGSKIGRAIGPDGIKGITPSARSPLLQWEHCPTT